MTDKATSEQQQNLDRKQAEFVKDTYGKSPTRSELGRLFDILKGRGKGKRGK